jgi:hypothetical protein
MWARRRPLTWSTIRPDAPGIAGLNQELEHAARVGDPDGRRLALAEGHPRDRKGVARIALAGPPDPDPLAVTQLGRHFDGRQAGGQQDARRRGAIPA